MILKQIVVCKLHPVQESQRHVYFQYHNDGHEDRQGFYMTRKAWIEMNAPRTITITVEAGDKIPEEDEHQKLLLDKVPSRMPPVAMPLTEPPVAP